MGESADGWDANEAEIVEALCAQGIEVWRLGGTGLPDLLCLYRGRWTPLEVTSQVGRLTSAQRWPVVRTVTEALAVFTPAYHWVSVVG